MSEETAQSLRSSSCSETPSEDAMKILVVDDEEGVRELVKAAMMEQGYQVWIAASGQHALDLGAEFELDLVFCDVVMDGMSGFEVLKGFRGTLRSEAEIVLMTGQASVEAAIEAVQRGANDYICKPFSIGVLQAIASAVEQRRYPSKLVAIETSRTPQQEILGSSPAMIDVVKTAARVAATDLPVMIRGESGTGKELIARLIHRRSPRAERPFVAQNCGALPDTLLESELFGHTRGAFTGATGERKGLFEEADGGAIFLDEVGETSPAMQQRLLRVLQEGEVRRVGGAGTRHVDVRVVAATNADLEADVAAGRFRRDLYYRLNVFPIRLPPLRERAEDIPALADHFLREACRRARRAVPAVGM